MSAVQVRLEIADRVAVVTLDRPPVNALSSRLCGEISSVWRAEIASAAGVAR